MAIDLLFSQTPAPNGALVFGGDTAGPVSKDAAVTFGGKVSELSGTVTFGETGFELTLAGSLPGLSGQVPLGVNALTEVGFVATLPALTGAISLETNGVSHLTFSGSLPSLVGELHFSVQLPVQLALAGSLPGLSGTVPLSALVPTILSLSGGLPTLSGVFSLFIERPATVFITGSLPALTGSMLVRYDSRTERPEVLSVRGRFQQGNGLEVGVQGKYHAGLPTHASIEAAWERAVQLIASSTAAWGEANRELRPSATSRYQRAEALQTGTIRSRFQEGQPVRGSVSSHFERAIQLTVGHTSHWQETFKDRRPWMDMPYQEGVPLFKSLDASASSGVHLSALYVLRYQEAMRLPAGTWARPLPPAPVNPCYTPNPALLFEEAWAERMQMIFICEKHGGVIPPVIGQIVVPIRKVYMVFNEVTIRRVTGNIVVPATAFSMSLDMDSWTWSFNATVPAAFMPQLESAPGEAVEIEATINGVVVLLLVEDLKRDRTFPTSKLSITGRGRNALLGSPYAYEKSFFSTAARTAQQLMLDVLTVNGVSIGWDVDFGLTDWNVPAGAWSHQGSYITALQAIAEAAGGYLQPHNTANTLRILPRYPTASWNWNTDIPAATTTMVLPEDIAIQEGIAWKDLPVYDRVYVSGNTQGVVGNVKRTGTAGTRVAPMVTDALITDQLAARQRGIAVLSKSGRQAMVAIRMPILTETGIILPGQLVSYQEASVTRNGIVRAVSVDTGDKVRQSLSIETYV